MLNKIKGNKIILIVGNIFLFLFASIMMYNFYKTLSGFIANGFRDGLKMIALISSYLLPAVVYLAFFYKSYIKDTPKLSKILSTSVITLWTIFNIVVIAIYRDMYKYNASSGIYDALIPTIGYFPLDMLAINTLIVLKQGFNFARILEPNEKLEVFLSSFKKPGYLNIKLWEYALYCLIAILAFVFVGSFFVGFRAIENVTYDPAYIYLLLWVLLPTFNLVTLIFKVENKLKTPNTKRIYLASVLAVNIIFTLVLFIIEANNPSFMVNIAKPLFAIAFSVSLPIEMLAILGITLASSIVAVVKLIKVKNN